MSSTLLKANGRAEVVASGLLGWPPIVKPSPYQGAGAQMIGAFVFVIFLPGYFRQMLSRGERIWPFAVLTWMDFSVWLRRWHGDLRQPVGHH